MKGLVFDKFLAMVEKKFGLELVDRIVEFATLPSGGACTSVGTYDHNELIALVQALSNEVQIPVPELVRGFGRYLFGSCRERSR